MKGFICPSSFQIDKRAHTREEPNFCKQYGKAFSFNMANHSQLCSDTWKNSYQGENE